jgi:hypothetical protein
MIRVRVDGRSVTVESDNPSYGVEHYFVQTDTELLGAMRSFGIHEIEASEYDFLHEAFCQEFEKQSGSKYMFCV